jgi:hypothetical protein
VTLGGVPLAGYGLALAITIGIEVPIVAAFFPGRRRRMALVCALATAATHLALHLLFLRFLPPGLGLVCGEAFATLAEAAAYAAAARGDAGRTLVASAVANATSYGLGSLIIR